MVAKLTVCYVRKFIIIQLSVQKVPFVSSFVSLVKTNSLLQISVFTFHFVSEYWENYPLIVGSA